MSSCSRSWVLGGVLAGWLAGFVMERGGYGLKARPNIAGWWRVLPPHRPLEQPARHEAWLGEPRNGGKKGICPKDSRTFGAACPRVRSARP
jgi:hypothetical protein